MGLTPRRLGAAAARPSGQTFQVADPRVGTAPAQAVAPVAPDTGIGQAFASLARLGEGVLQRRAQERQEDGRREGQRAGAQAALDGLPAPQFEGDTFYLRAAQASAETAWFAGTQLNLRQSVIEASGNAGDDLDAFNGEIETLRSGLTELAPEHLRPQMELELNRYADAGRADIQDRLDQARQRDETFTVYQSLASLEEEILNASNAGDVGAGEAAINRFGAMVTAAVVSGQIAPSTAAGMIDGIQDNAAREYLMGQHRAAMEAGLGEQYIQAVETGGGFGGGMPLVDAVIQIESGGQVGAVSSAGAMGMMQLMPATAQQMSEELGIPYDPDRLLSDPQYNILLGTRYLEQMRVQYGNIPALYLAAYNAGPGNVNRWIEQFGDPRNGEITPEEFTARIPFEETRNHTNRILALMRDDSAGISQLAGLAPADRRALAGTMRSQQQRHAAERAVNTAALGAELDRVQAAVDQGLVPQPAQLTSLQLASAQTNDPQTVQRVENLVGTATALDAVRSMPPTQIRQVVEEGRAEIQAVIDAGGQPSDADLAALDAMERYAVTAEAAINQDPIGHGERVGLIPPTIIDPAGMAPATLAAALVERDAAMQAGMAGFGELPMLRPEEAALLSRRLTNPEIPISQTLADFTELALQMGADRFERLLGEIGADDPVLAVAGAMLTEPGYRATATDVIAGHRHMAEAMNVLPGPSEVLRRQETDTVIGTAYAAAGPGEVRLLIETAEAIYTSRAVRRGATDPGSFNRSLWRDSLQAAAGYRIGPDGSDFGGISEIRGTQLVMPRGMTHSQVEALFGESWLADGAPIRGAYYDDGQAADINLSDVYPVAVGDGQVLLSTARITDRQPGEFLLAEDGTLFRLDLREAWEGFNE